MTLTLTLNLIRRIDNGQRTTDNRPLGDKGDACQSKNRQQTRKGNVNDLDLNYNLNGGYCRASTIIRMVPVVMPRDLSHEASLTKR